MIPNAPGTGPAPRSDSPKPFDFPDQTVDFAQEILDTPPAELANRVKKLSPDMRTTVLIEIVRRFQETAAEKVQNDKELTNLRYHAERLEKILLELARGKGK
ncbi:MAG: hypothetical protein MUC63_10300 [Planctomycetes bacterium]|nr:hypothetical protein [Planctomycetota bacterium]